MLDAFRMRLNGSGTCLLQDGLTTAEQVLARSDLRDLKWVQTNVAGSDT